MQFKDFSLIENILSPKLIRLILQPFHVKILLIKRLIQLSDFNQLLDVDFHVLIVNVLELFFAILQNHVVSVEAFDVVIFLF